MTRKKKPDSWIKKANTILCILFFLAMVAVGIQFFTMLAEYQKARQEYSRLRKRFVTEYGEQTEDMSEPETEDGTEENTDEIVFYPDPPIRVDFKDLKKVNPDVVAWIYIGCIDASYPVLQGTDNTYYLHHTTEGEYNFAGSIFMEYVNSPNMTDKNTVIYGHNMRDGSMFGMLDEIIPDRRYQDDATFWVITPTYSYQYQMFSIFVSRPSGDCYLIPDPTDAEGFVEWAESMKALSKKNLSRHIFIGDDRVVTLSTCTAEHTTRTIVQGYLTAAVPNRH